MLRRLLIASAAIAGGCTAEPGHSAGAPRSDDAAVDAFIWPQREDAGCPPSSCAHPPPDACDGDRTVRHPPEGACRLELGDVRCGHRPDPSLGEDCAASGRTCRWGRCVGDTPPVLPPGAHFAWLDTLAVAEDRGDAACCHDYTGDGVPDNRLGRALFRVAAVTDADEGWANRMMQLQVDRGHFALLLATAPDAAWLFSAEPAAEPFDPHGEGAPGPMRLLPDGFADGRPVTAASAASPDEGGRLAARFDDAVLWLPMEQVRLALRVSDLRIEARPRDDGWEDGTIAALVRLPDLFDALNEGLRAECPCLGADPPAVFLYGSEGTDATCARPDLSACTATEDQAALDCARIVESCPILTSELRPEIDADRSGVPETTTLGLRFTARPARDVSLPP
jgi:hypothetical protein